jgi:hypothetical protein
VRVRVIVAESDTGNRCVDGESDLDCDCDCDCDTDPDSDTDRVLHLTRS